LRATVLDSMPGRGLSAEAIECTFRKLDGSVSLKWFGGNSAERYAAPDRGGR